MKINVLLSDPKLKAACLFEHIPRDVNWIHFDCPDTIMDAIPLPLIFEV